MSSFYHFFLSWAKGRYTCKRGSGQWWRWYIWFISKCHHSLYWYICRAQLSLYHGYVCTDNSQTHCRGVLERCKEESLLQLENAHNEKELTTMDKLEDLNTSQVLLQLITYGIQKQCCGSGSAKWQRKQIRNGSG